MEISFAFSIENYKAQEQIVNKLRRYILATGNTLSVDWVQIVENNLSNFNKFKTRRLFNRSIDALAECSAVIIEGSYPNFETIALLHEAIKAKKPVLILTNEEDRDSERAIDIQADYTESALYNEESYETIIQYFIEKNKNQPLSRFNILLERKQKNYLDWADRFYRQSKSEIIRNLIDQKAQNDLNYPQK